ncbi:MAG: hypothetical protein ABW328_00605 [Ilumatobacteraceae bacterium]
MQLSNRLRHVVARRARSGRSNGRRGAWRRPRHLALASVAVLITQCGPTECAPTTPAPSGHFATLPPGSALPSSAECAARVRPAGENRPGNGGPNATTGYSYAPTYSWAAPQLGRVDGAFTGTTDQILQWAACKWGIDEDVVRAQIAKESWWQMSTLGDYGNWPAGQCAPGHGRDANGNCPQSVGLGQVRYGQGDGAFPGVQQSSAMNVDVTYAYWRSCFEGQETWLNDVERGQQYAAGDMWGCVGRWFSGRWYTAPANEYIGAVQSYLSQRIWETANF